MRPPVSIVVPFRGDAPAAAETAATLGALALASGDELVVADNNPEPVEWPHASPIRVVAAGARASSYFARNRGAAAARNEWLLFLDADCVPPTNLLDEYMAGPPAEEVGIFAGELRGVREQDGRLARWARSRRGLLASHHQYSGPYAAGITGNLLVRRAAWEAVGGFEAGVRSGADVDFSWRVQAAGWRLRYTPQALVGHRDPERFATVLRQAFRYGTGRRWLRRRHGAAVPRPGTARGVVRGVAGAVIWPLAAQPERALFKLIDALVAIAMGLGYAFGNNRAP